MNNGRLAARMNNVYTERLYTFDPVEFPVRAASSQSASMGAAVSTSASTTPSVWAANSSAAWTCGFRPVYYKPAGRGARRRKGLVVLPLAAHLVQKDGVAPRVGPRV